MCRLSLCGLHCVEAVVLWLRNEPLGLQLFLILLLSQGPNSRQNSNVVSCIHVQYAMFMHNQALFKHIC